MLASLQQVSTQVLWQRLSVLSLDADFAIVVVKVSSRKPGGLVLGELQDPENCEWSQSGLPLTPYSPFITEVFAFWFYLWSQVFLKS